MVAILILMAMTPSSARLVDTSLGPVMGERLVMVVTKNHPHPHQDIHGGPTLLQCSYYL